MTRIFRKKLYYITKNGKIIKSLGYFRNKQSARDIINKFSIEQREDYEILFTYEE